VHHVNPSCGDEVTLGVKLDGDNVASINWEGVGCSISQASTSIMSDLLTGKTLAEATAISEDFLRLMQSKGSVEGDPEVLEDAVALSGVSKYPARIKCALLGWMAFKDASVQAHSKEEK
jgi:nitrogen fixation NifU-like protein